MVMFGAKKKQMGLQVSQGGLVEQTSLKTVVQVQNLQQPQIPQGRRQAVTAWYGDLPLRHLEHPTWKH